jgi:2-oxoglutarate dehydrogenase E1 component
MARGAQRSTASRLRWIEELCEANREVADPQSQTLDVLSEVPLFEHLPAHALKTLAAASNQREFPAEEALCRQGELDRDLFVVLEGSARVVRGGRAVASIWPGEIVGELAFLDRQPRSADVIATTPMRVLAIPAERLDQLMDDYPAIARALLAVLASRVREVGSRQLRVEQLIRAHRERGHVMADLDPLGLRHGEEYPELTPEHYGLSQADLKVAVPVMIGELAVTRRIGDVLDHLRQVYCDAVGVQYMHIDDLAVQSWLRERLENPRSLRPLGRDDQLRILRKLTEAEVFETFLQGRFSRAKRFSLEGGETLIPLLDQAIARASSHGIEEVVIGMAHRGRLNVLANVLGKPAHQIFREFESGEEAERKGPGDVRYHLGFSTDAQAPDGQPIRLSLCFNPSHLEAVSPVVLGRARALQEQQGDPDGERTLPLIIHGDAAFAGQGVVQELFNLSQLPGFATGGALHIVVNNQIGFTTPPEEGRSTQYATDVARMLQIPIFHVNGERPGAVDRVIRLAMEFRQTFQRDVVIDMYCYRLHGHNEGDEPGFTQPLLTEAVASRKPIRQSYARNLIALGDVSAQEADEIAVDVRGRFEAALEAAQAEPRRLEADHQPPAISEPAGTHPDQPTLVSLLERLTDLPADFALHPRLERMMKSRRAMAAGKRVVDWGAAEALAYAAIVRAGVPVRLTGQDSERGTFAHRHAVLHDSTTDARHVPLQHVDPSQAPFTIHNSPLSETGVLGFEFGYSLERGRALVLWEAQFGDFANVSQVVIDQFVSASEAKWGQQSGLCLLLPHGYEGQGPEHSSARIERFLQLAAADNMRVVQPTSAAQLYHLLLDQAWRTHLKPMIVFTPKRLLQHPSMGSPLEALATGGFRPVRAVGPSTENGAVERLILSSGQLVHALARELGQNTAPSAALLALDSLYPFPGEELEHLLDQFPALKTMVWVQDEPSNMGAWPFLRPRLETLCDGRLTLESAARAESASPATGSQRVHQAEHEELTARALGL